MSKKYIKVVKHVHSVIINQNIYFSQVFFIKEVDSWDFQEIENSSIDYSSSFCNERECNRHDVNFIKKYWYAKNKST